MPKVSLAALSQEKFLREIHHLLWITPRMNGGVFDQGWCCRDHAWATALLAHWLGFKPVLFHGQAWFIAGPTNARPGTGVHQSTHSWVGIDGLGSIDISIRPTVVDDREVSAGCLYANRLHPRGTVSVVSAQGEFERAANYLSRKANHLTALYLMQRAEQVDQGHVQYAAGWIKSPLTDDLRSQHGEPTEMYAAMLLHLRAFLLGEAKTLSALTKEQAWNQIASARAGAISKALQAIQEGFPLEPPSNVPGRSTPQGMDSVRCT